MQVIELLNISGLVIGGLGAFLVFINTPKVSSSVIIHSDEGCNQLAPKDKRKNNFGRFGMLMVAIGFALQLVAQFL